MSEPAGHKPIIRVVSAEIQREGRYLITQRLPGAVLPDLWEFPGGRVRDGESDADALGRALGARLGITLSVGEQVLEVTHDYDDYAVTLVCYQATAHGEPQPRKVQALAWAGPEELGDYSFPGADRHTVDLLLGR